MAADDLENPSLIDEGPTSANLGKPLAPLILIHDGGGTTFSYHCLDPLNRPVYGIHNPHLHQGGWWDGGIPAIASHYIDLLAKILPHGGEILLGGWSFGGLLSFEMAHLLATTHSRLPRFRVMGMIFIDSVFPLYLTNAGDLPEKPIVKTPAELSAMKLREKVDLNMTHARMMGRAWNVPAWKGIPVPPTVLLRAKDELPGANSIFASTGRSLRALGWEKFEEESGKKFIDKVVDIEGNHFSIFEFDKIPAISAKIRAAADSLDEPAF